MFSFKNTVYCPSNIRVCVKKEPVSATLISYIQEKVGVINQEANAAGKLRITLESLYKVEPITSIQRTQQAMNSSNSTW